MLDDLIQVDLKPFLQRRWSRITFPRITRTPGSSTMSRCIGQDSRQNAKMLGCRRIGSRNGYKGVRRDGHLLTNGGGGSLAATQHEMIDRQTGHMCLDPKRRLILKDGMYLADDIDLIYRHLQGHKTLSIVNSRRARTLIPLMSEPSIEPI